MESGVRNSKTTMEVMRTACFTPGARRGYRNGKRGNMDRTELVARRSRAQPRTYEGGKHNSQSRKTEEGIFSAIRRGLYTYLYILFINQVPGESIICEICFLYEYTYVRVSNVPPRPGIKVSIDVHIQSYHQ